MSTDMIGLKPHVLTFSEDQVRRLRDEWLPCYSEAAHVPVMAGLLRFMFERFINPAIDGVSVSKSEEN